MNKQTLLLLVVIALLLIPTGVIARSYTLPHYDRLTAEGSISYCVAALEVNKEAEPKTPDVSAPKTCSKCNGTKTVLTPDGVTRIPCPCGKDCKCVGMAPAGVRKPVVRILYVGSAWCAPCKQVSEFTMPTLIKSGWQVNGPNKGGHLEKFDFDLDSELISDYHVVSLPTWIRLEDEKEVDRHEGFLNAWGVLHFQKGVDIVPTDLTLRTK